MGSNKTVFFIVFLLISLYPLLNEGHLRVWSLIIAVIFSPKATDRIPLIEQKLSAGAACLALLNSALADGWGANWLTGWMSRDKDFLKKGLKLKNDEFVAGFIHIGTPKSTPLERERPNMGEITEWLT